MFLGIDIGGTSVKLGVVDDNYNIIKSYSIRTETDNGGEHFVSTIIEKAREIEKEIPFHKIGIGTPGTIDYEKGICIRASNLPYKNTPMKALIEDALSKEVKIANDATAAICGELYAGVGKRFKSFIMITLGTGIGGGIVIDGRVYRGKRGGAGEFGHMIIKHDGIECRCGQHGCYERYASVTALIEQTKRKAEAHRDSLLYKMSLEGISGRTAFDAMKQGCEIAREVVDEYISYVAVGAIGLTRIFQPEVIVFGGAISNEGDYLINPLKEKITLPVEILTSELKNSAGILGAVAISKEGI